MKWLTLSLPFIVAFAGCSSTQSVEPARSELIQDQRLVSTFTRHGVKLEWSCKWLTGITEKTCVKGNIVGIEATGYAPAYGTTEALRETAFGVAHDVALDKLVRFIKTDLTSSRVTKTLTKSVEKANELLNTNLHRSAEVNDLETTSADTSTSGTDHSNVNETVRTVIENIRTQATGIVRGAQVLDEQVIDKKTVAVTVRWTPQVADQSKFLSPYFK